MRTGDGKRADRGDRRLAGDHRRGRVPGRPGGAATAGGDPRGATGRRSLGEPGGPLADHAGGDVRPHPDAAVGPDRDHALVRLRWVPHPELARRHRVRSVVRGAIRVADHWALDRVRMVGRHLLLADSDRHRLPDRRPPTAPSAARRAVEPVLRIHVLAGVLRRGRHRRGGDLRSAAPRPGVRPRGGHPLGLPAHLVRRGAVRRTGRADAREPDLLPGHGQDRHLDDLGHRDRPASDDGRRLAPLHRLVEHLVQARPGQAGARRTATDHGGRRAARLRRHRGPRRGHRPRRRKGRGLHLEGLAGLHELHRVRPLPVAVPRLEHREAPVARSC